MELDKSKHVCAVPASQCADDTAWSALSGEEDSRQWQEADTASSIVPFLVISSPDPPTAPEEDKVRMCRDRHKEKKPRQKEDGR